MFEPFTITAITLTFLLAGLVKGVVGMGLPTVCLGLMTALFDLPTAMALLIVPSFATNLWQGVVGGNGLAILKRIWLFLAMATITVWAGAKALTAIDLGYLSALLGGLLIAYAASGLSGFRLSIPAPRQIWAGPLFGTANGVLTGMTGSFVVPGVMYLQAIGMGKDMLVQAMGMLFTVSTVALALALQNNALLTQDLSIASAAGLVPAIVGMILGQKVRDKLSEDRFRQVFFIAVLALGIYIIASALKSL